MYQESFATFLQETFFERLTRGSCQLCLAETPGLSLTESSTQVLSTMGSMKTETVELAQAGPCLFKS
jgi:hypothetical protein